jgi:predicted aspartyl protease
MVAAGLLLLLLNSGAINTKASPVFTGVYIGTQGPYRFLVDTGSEATLIDPVLAAKLHLEPQFRSEVVTQYSTRLVPGLKTAALRLGQRTLPETEVLFHDVTEARRLDPSVSGVLGLAALSSLDFTLSPSTGSLDQEAKRPLGTVVPFFRIDGRMAVKARMGNEVLTLILDSGATHVVLFRTPAAMASVPPVSTTFTTLDGARNVVATCWTADMFFGDSLRVGTLPAAIVQRKDSHVEGLLPASVFRRIYVDHGRSELVLVR